MIVWELLRHKLHTSWSVQRSGTTWPGWELPSSIEYSNLQPRDRVTCWLCPWLCSLAMPLTTGMHIAIVSFLPLCTYALAVHCHFRMQRTHSSHRSIFVRGRLTSAVTRHARIGMLECSQRHVVMLANGMLAHGMLPTGIKLCWHGRASLCSDNKRPTWIRITSWHLRP
jgi:hypothetical protein